jgi:hypothetical protein
MGGGPPSAEAVLGNRNGPQRTMQTQPSNSASVDANDFSLVLGGPLFQLLRRSHLSGNTLELLRRRIVVISSFVWVPLLVLSLVDGLAWGNAVAVPFLFDVDAHVRFLVALPLLIATELLVHQRTRLVVSQFVSQGLVLDAIRARFDAALESALRLRNSIVAELLIVAFVYGVGIFVLWRYYMVLDVPTWYATPADGRVHLRLAGWWYLFISLPVFQFIFVRWYFRMFIWARFLWQVSRLPLAYSPLHPDRTGGMGFLSGITRAYAPLLLAQGTLLAGALANTILFEGKVLTSFYVEVVSFAAVIVFVVVGPLLVFMLPLAAAKRAGLRELGQLSRRYVDEFDQKWLRGQAPPHEPLVGSADIQSLADLGNSFETMRSMSVIPITWAAVVQLVIVVLLPIIPLLLTLISLEELLKRIVKVLI